MQDDSFDEDSEKVFDDELDGFDDKPTYEELMRRFNETNRRFNETNRLLDEANHLLNKANQMISQQDKVIVARNCKLAFSRLFLVFSSSFSKLIINVQCATNASFFSYLLHSSNFRTFSFFIGSFIDQIPPIEYNGNSTTSTASQNDFTKVRCKFVPTEYISSFSVSDFQRPEIPALWDVAQRMNGYYDTERAFANLVRALLMDVIDATPFFRMESHGVEVMPDTSVKGSNPDAIVLKKRNNVPFFVVEVKKPGIFQKLTDPKLELIYGQLFDYLCDVRNEYGVKNPYGMLTTFNEFQICWLDDGDAMRRRRLKGSPVLRIDVDHPTSLEAIGAIASALIQAYNSPISPPTRTNVIGKSCKVFFAKNMGWRRADATLVFKFPSEATQVLFINRVFHQGKEGKAYHVFNSNGRQAVLKFILRTQYNHRRLDHFRCIAASRSDSLYAVENDKDTDDEKLLTREKNYWGKINGIYSLRIITANTKKALLMPYIEPLTTSEKQQFLDQNSSIFKQISSIFDFCVNQGLHQTDAAWRHIGWYKYGGVKKIKLFDFGHVVEFDQNDSGKKEELKNAMLGALHGELGNISI